MATKTKAEKAAVEPKVLRKTRGIAHRWLFGFFLAVVVIYRFSDDLLLWLMQVEAGGPLDTDPPALPDLGMAALQPLFLKVAYLLFGISVSALLAGFMEKRLRVDAFSNNSRWGILFILFLLCYSLLGA